METRCVSVEWVPSRCDLVWGKLKHTPWWPAIVITDEDCGRENTSDSKMWLYWLGEHRLSEVLKDNIVPFEECFDDKISKKMNKNLESGLKEMLVIYAKRYALNVTEKSSLFQWGKELFKKRSNLSNRKRPASKELPVDIMQVLEDSKKPRSDNLCETECLRQIDSVVKEIRMGLRNIKDVCLVCCQKDSVIEKHPLFHGGVCRYCKRAVNKIRKSPVGVELFICIVCGEGGTLVYCSVSECLGSFCELCIKHLVGREVFQMIVQNDSWRCFICLPSNDPMCLIMPKNKGLVLDKMEVDQNDILQLPDPVPIKRGPIRVITHSEIALRVLEAKNIIVSNCLPKISDSSSSINYIEKEIKKLAHNFVYASSFGSVGEKKQRGSISFFESFYQFVFWVDIAKKYCPSVFFMFLSTAEQVNAKVRSRVHRFLEIEPAFIKRKGNEFVLWTNVPRPRQQSFNRRLKSLEEGILEDYLDPLKFYFERNSSNNLVGKKQSQ